MQFAHIATTLVVSLFLGVANANTNIDSFFARDNHQETLQVLQATGQIAKQRQQYLIHCEKSATSDTERAECACAHQALAQLSDRLFYYESVMAYQEYMARAEAAPDARVALRAEQAKRPNALREIEQQCQSAKPDTNASAARH